jgi:hypothetical protein
MFGWEEVYTGYSKDDFEAVINWLEEKTYTYKYNIFDRGRGMMASLSAKGGKKYSAQFCIYVKKEDYEEVRFLLGKASLETSNNED